MPTSILAPDLSATTTWQALAAHRQQMEDVHLRDLFAEDPNRFERFSLRFGDILFDYSKNRITQETIELLLALASQASVDSTIEAMFNGAKINTTEDRAVLHIALRNRDNRYLIDSQLQKSETYTGIEGINTQDHAIQESMGPIVDRTKEHLIGTDRAVVTARNILLRAADAAPEAHTHLEIGFDDPAEVEIVVVIVEAAVEPEA